MIYISHAYITPQTLNNPFTPSMPQAKMKRKEIQIYLLLAFIFTASQCHYSTAMRNIHTAESGKPLS
jgi:hypothetical protein